MAERDQDNGTHVPQWLTGELFIEILQKEQPDFEKILKFECNLAVRDGENFSTTLLRLSITYQLKDGSSQQTSFIVKLLSQSEQMQELVREWKLFDKEAYTYSVLIPAFEEMFHKAGKEVHFGPKFYTIDPKKTNGQPIIILEDLKQRHFKNIKRQEGLDIDHTKEILSKLAEFHAASAVYYETHGPYPEMYQQVLCSKEDKFAEFRDNQCKEFRECLDLYKAKHLDEKIRTYRSKLPDQYQLKVAPNPEIFQCLNHGDLWCNNFMFAYDSEGHLLSSLFVDLQMSCYSSPNHDLYYLLLTSTNYQIKIKKFDFFLHYYHQQLVENLKLLKYTKLLPTLRDISMELLRDCGWAFTCIINVLPLALLDPMEDANIDNVLGKEEKIDKNSLKKQMYRNERFVKNMLEVLPWMENKGLLD